MDILRGFNQAMEYIEQNLCEEIDIETAAKATGYSSYHFSKIFCYLADMSLSEYIRRRKMTLAAMELQNTDSKVIDVAIKYGYDSPDSFARAFTKLHNVSPSQAKMKGTILKTYPKLSFQITIINIFLSNIYCIRCRIGHHAFVHPVGRLVSFSTIIYPLLATSFHQLIRQNPFSFNSSTRRL